MLHDELAFITIHNIKQGKADKSILIWLFILTVKYENVS